VNKTLEQKIEWLVDYTEIQELISAYANTVDDHDFEAWKNLFTEDGGYGSGADRIPKDLLASAAEGLLAAYPRTHHFFGLPAITINGTEAEARCPGVTHHVKVAEHPSQSSIVGGWLRLRLRKTTDGWQIVSAYADVSWTEGGDYFAGAAEVVEQFVGNPDS
jgi:SnoaL-like domain